ncbi:MAG: hypothetical protein BGO47_00505 [Microbacterium sp. 67-17]|uniref:PDR/VanB family oxidoreductase n=1 Tax=Microbacterium sp. 67-17 TaxID=1895782 RepID=UPI000962047A|nr:PDR/VanB family oxidoreductase [Microbacterium sp. 67-17]OJV93950.1 MAG: hypothetical protein BGO47_00505 [Microbacterium sp. 67-17]
MSTTELAASDRVIYEAVVSEVARVADAIVAVTFAADTDLPPWDPGAHIDLELPNGKIRQYSLCGPHHRRRELRIAVLREQASRGGSIAVHELAVGTPVRILAVRNYFPLGESDEYVFIAGGIGIAPLMPMIEAVEARGIPWTLHYSGRSLSSMAYSTSLQEAYPDRVMLYPSAHGRRIDLRAVLSSTAPGAGLYCCGPARLMKEFEETCALQGVEGHLERFAAAADTTADLSEDRPFEVHLARTGITVMVEPGQTILEVAEAAGGDVFASCEEGICGTCETRVIEGDVDHRDSVLCGRDTGTMMICISRALGSRLVIDA